MILKGLYFISCNIGKAKECKRDIYQKNNNNTEKKKRKLLVPILHFPLLKFYKEFPFNIT